MKYVAIDIETTGLDPDQHQILEIGAVIETDWRTPVDALPVFRTLVWHPNIVGSREALYMNAELIAESVECPQPFPGLNDAIYNLGAFLGQHFDRAKESVTIAGKNFAAFDLRFLSRCGEWGRSIRHKRRFIDIGPMWWRPDVDDALPDLRTCQERAGVAVRTAHKAVEDCRAVIECVRAWNEKGKK